MNQKDTALLRKLGACEDAREWCKTVPDLETAWNTCKRSDWMLWALDAIGYKDDKALRLYSCACIRGTPLGDGRTVWDLLTYKRSRNAVEVSERYANGQATDKELSAAEDAAEDAAWDAAWDAASDAARTAARAAAWDAAWDAASDAARAAASAAAWDAAWAASDAARDAARAASDAARAAASAAAREWQADKLREYVTWDQIAAIMGEEE